MYTIELRLDTRGYDDYLEKKFKYGYKLKRALVNYFNMQENRRVNSDRYKELAERMQELNTRQDIIKDTKDKDKKKLLKEAYKELSEEVKQGWIELNDSFGLGNGKFVDYKNLGQASVMYERYASEGIINWSSFENMAQATKQGYLKRRKQADSDNTLKVPRYVDFNTLWYRKCNNNITPDGLRFGKRGNYIIFPYIFKGSDEIRFTYALERQKIAWYGVKRTLDRHNKWLYSVLIVFSEVPYGLPDSPVKQGKVVVSVDVDKLAIKTLNVDTEEEVFFDIADDFGYSDKISYYDRKLEESRRQSNPDNYNANGTIKEGKRSWVRTKNYNTLLARKRTLWHKVKQSRRNRFHNIAKAIVLNCDEIVVVKEDFKALQKRKDYNPEEMKWTDSRKQRGAEIMFNAPYEFIELLKQKASYLGLSYSEITKEKQ